VQCIE